MTSSDLWDADTADRYDRDEVDMFAPDVLGPTVEFLAARADGGPALELAIGDMATTRVEGEFGLAYLVFNTIGNLRTQEEQVACFANAARHLRPGGRFVVEVWVPPLRRLPQGQSAVPFDVSEKHVGFDTMDLVTQQGTSHHYSRAEEDGRDLGPIHLIGRLDIDHECGSVAADQEIVGDVSADGVVIAAGQTERLARDRHHVAIEVRQHEAVTLQQALVSDEVPGSGGPPPPRIVPHAGVRPERPHRHAAHDVFSAGISQCPHNVLALTGRVPQLHLATRRPAHATTMPPS